EILPYLVAQGVDPQRLTYVLITHSDLDHQGGNQAVKAVAPQARFLCHDFDRPWIESTEALIAGRYSQFEADDGIGYGDAGKAAIRADCQCIPVDLTLSGGERFYLSADWWVEVVHTPGHTWGHLAVWDPRSRTLISGEATMGTSIPADDWSPAMPPTYCYVDTYLSTQDRLLAMPIEQLASAHWPLQTGSAVRDFVAESRAYCAHVGARLLEYCSETGGFTLRQAVDTLGPRLGEWPAATNGDFSYGMAGNLESLTKRGLLRLERNEQGHRLWRPA
ncbi:MAG: MBL fold metallo-hydrolase, partial [Caldilineaceae bacterium]